MKQQNGTGLARIAYDAYGLAVDYKNFQGKKMPEWDQLPPKIQKAWVAAAHASATELARILSVPETYVKVMQEAAEEVGEHSPHSRTPDLSGNPAPQINRVQQF